MILYKFVQFVEKTIDSGNFLGIITTMNFDFVYTCGGCFVRTAWTGGDTPTSDFLETAIGRQLVDFFYQDQINDCGGMEGVKNWLFGDQTLEEKLTIFRNRAEYDAWATFKNPVDNSRETGKLISS